MDKSSDTAARTERHEEYNGEKDTNYDKAATNEPNGNVLIDQGKESTVGGDNDRILTSPPEHTGRRNCQSSRKTSPGKVAASEV